MAAFRAGLAAAGWALLGSAALAGVALSAVTLLAATDLGRPFIASTIVRFADEAVAGRLTLEGIRVLPGGGVELTGLRVEDPDGHLVLAVDRARVSADVTRIRSRVIGLRVELDGPAVLLEEEPDGGLSLARAFAPSHPAAPGPERPRAGRDEGPGWTVRVIRLAIRGGDLWWLDARGATRLEAQALSVEARGAIGPDVSRAEVRLTGAVDVPLSAPLEVELRVRRAGDAVRLRRLAVRVGDTRLEAIGEGDVGRRTGRLHVARLGVDGAQARALFPAARLGADLDAEAYAESDGAIATAAAHVAPARGDAGRADAAVAVALEDAVAIGFDVVLDRLDPSKVVGGAPAGEVTLAAHGAAAGRSAESLRARLDLSLARSRLRGGEAGPAEVVLRADRGSWELARGTAAAPGLAVEASGRWRAAGAVSGRLEARSGDLAAATRNLSRLLDVRLPALGGDVRVAGTLSGTTDAPSVTGSLAARRLAVGGLAAAGLRAEGATSGPLRAPTVRVDAGADALRSGGDAVAHALLLRGTLAGGEAQLSGSAAVPALGRDPVSVQARARLGERAETLAISELAIAYPGTRYALVRPATVTLAGPSVDRLELAAGPQRLALEGGVGPRGALEARLEVERLDLARLPVGAPGARERIAGRLGAELHATGTTGRPRLSGQVSLEDAAFRTLVGLRGAGEVAWDGGSRRAVVSLSGARADGGTAEVALDLPLPLADRPGEPVSLRVRAAGLPIEALLEAAGEPPPAGAVRTEPPVAGTLGFDASVTGTAGAPLLHAAATVDDGRVDDLGAIALTATAHIGAGRLDLHAEAALSGRPAIAADASVPLDPAALVAQPARAARALRSAPLSGQVRVPGLELAVLEGRLGVPDGLRGRVQGEATLSGTIDAPRGAAALDLADGAFAGYARVAARLEVDAGAARVDARARVSIDGSEVVRATGSLAAPVERLGTRDGLRRAALALEATVPRVALARAAQLDVPLAGTLEARLTADGTLAAPRIALDASGSGLAVDGRPLGDATLAARSGSGRVTAEARLTPAAGGALSATFAAQLAPGLDLEPSALRAAPAELAVRARAVDLGFVPAVAPGIVRTASGRLDADVTARGPLGKLSPLGTLRIADGRFAISEYGDFTGVTVDAAVTDDAVEVKRVAARRGSGTFEASGALRGLRGGTANLQGHIAADGFVLSRAGMELATLTTRADATGTYRPGDLRMRLDVPRGTVRLPKRTPRTLQPLERRSDIIVGRPPAPRAPRRGAGAAAGGDERPFALTVRLVAPGRFDVVSDSPRVRIELKADATYELQGGDDYLSGSVEVVRGNVEPIGGRLFEIERGKVTFTGGPPKAAMLDVEARWDNPSAVVTVRVAGPLSDPEIKLTSQPPLDEAQIAMLIATGRTELKAGGGGVGTLTGEEAGKAVLGALATQVFKDLVADKLPLDSVALDSGAIRAGKYVGDRVYVGYTRRFEARPEQGENTNEIRVEYQISPRWSLESRYGDAQSGGASLIWSKDY